MSTSRDEVRTSRTLVLGVGNLLMGDDGLGPAALERLLMEWQLPPEVASLDGGTDGLALLPEIEGAECILLIDAIDVGAAPGSEVVLERGELPRHGGLRLSPHQVGLWDLLGLAELRGRLPRQAVALGLQPDAIVASPGLSDAVAARLPTLIGRIVERLGEWGHECRPVSLGP